MRVILFGAGREAKDFIRYCKYNKQMNSTEIVAVCDNNFQITGKEFSGYKIYKPEYICDCDCDGIIVNTTYQEEMISQLKYKLKVDKSIWTYGEYKILETIRENEEINKKNNQDITSIKSECFNKNSFVVYTAIFGDYDELKDVLGDSNKNVKYVCFTDNPHIKSKKWEIRYVPKFAEAWQMVKLYKILPHRYFPEYDTSLWIDASFLIKRDLSKLVVEFQRNASIMFIPHYDRICAYEEAAACLCSGLDEKTKILNQICAYRKEGFPENYGLPCGGFIARNHNDENVIKAMDMWYEEICKYSKRDQISLPYVLWKSNLRYDFCNLYYEKNDWFENGRHKLF